LETLKETSGRFRLTVALPIPFDGFGTLEIDLCAPTRAWPSNSMAVSTSRIRSR
jgi:hypothetical protein